MRKIRRPSKTPVICTLTFDLLGSEDERMSQYMWLKAQEKTTLAAVMQALFQCETTGRNKQEILDYFEGLLHADDLPWIADE